MVPENYQSHTISLYKSQGLPSNWKKVRELVNDFDGIDTTIFEYNKKWWMFSTLKRDSTLSENDELYIWYADTPLENWKPHRMNPIIYKEPIARGAGRPFIFDGTLYRPAQDCSRVYGGELLLKKVTVLTTDMFYEESVQKMSGFSPFSEAFHTFNCCGSVSVIDGVRSRYSLGNVWHNFKRLLCGKIFL